MRRRRQEAAVALFPFLSVLAAVIGTLAVIVTTTTLARLLAPRPEQPVEAPHEYLRAPFERLRLRRAAIPAEMRELEARIAEAL